MPFSSGRSVRAPASKATSTVVARVPGISIRWIGSPEGSVEDSMRAMYLSCQGAWAAPALEVEDVVAVHQDRVPATVENLANPVVCGAFRCQLGGHVLERPARLESSSVDQLNTYPCVVCHRVLAARSVSREG